MILGGFPVETVIRVRRRRVFDEMSGQDTLSDWSTADEQPIGDVLFASGPGIVQGAIGELPAVELEQSTASAVLYLPHGADIRADDRVRARGALWDVIGRRVDWPDWGSVVQLTWIRDEEEGWHG